VAHAGAPAGGALLAGAVAHTVMLEAHVEARWLSIEPRLGRRVVPRERPTHLIVDDPRDLPAWRAEVPDLVAGMRAIGEWRPCPDWEPPVRWTLYELAPGPPPGHPGAGP
jgi:hypothetical protein